MIPHDELRTWTDRARAWLAEHCDEDTASTDEEWGTGSDSVPIFNSLTHAEEAELIRRSAAWQRAKFDAGYGAIAMPQAVGGAGLTGDHERVFAELERDRLTPPTPELVGVTVGLIAPTIATLGTPEQRDEFVRRMLRADLLACQLFSEPEAGSDLAGLRCRAVQEGDEWVINGQKVWSSGAQFADVGELITRTDPAAPKHQGMTAFIVPMDLPGIEVRPIRQMSGGASFNEVFFNDVHLPDRYRLGARGDGWKVALTTLGFERGHSGRRRVGGSWKQLWALARHNGGTADAVRRQRIADAYVAGRLLELLGDRVAAARAAGVAPGPEGSLRKVLWVNQMKAYGEAAIDLLGPDIAVDHGEWGTFAWAEHVLGAPGFRIAGGSDEIQRNIIGERVLGLPREPRPAAEGRAP